MVYLYGCVAIIFFEVWAYHNLTYFLYETRVDFLNTAV